MWDQWLLSMGQANTQETAPIPDPPGPENHLTTDMENEKGGFFARFTAIFQTLELWRWSLILVGCICLIGGLMALFQTGQAISTDSSQPQQVDVRQVSSSESAKTAQRSAQVDAVDQIYIDVSGAVVKPGVYTVKKGERSGAIITAAGGFRPDAHQEYIRKHFNGAAALGDGQKIYIPFNQEIIEAGGAQAVNQPNGTVGGSLEKTTSINTASSKALDELPGIGAARAEQIIAARPYTSLSELVDRDVLSQAVFASLEGLISL